MIKYTGNPHGFLMEDWTHIYRDENTVTRLREHAVIQKNDPARGEGGSANTQVFFNRNIIGGEDSLSEHRFIRCRGSIAVL